MILLPFVIYYAHNICLIDSIRLERTLIVTRDMLELTAEFGLIGTVGAVSLAIAQLVKVDAHLVGGAQPLLRRAAKWRRWAVRFIAHVPAVIVTVADPA